MTDALSPLQAVLPTGMAALSMFLLLLSSGAVGMSIKNVVDSLLSDDEEEAEEAEDDELADGGGLMGEGGDDDFGDLGDLEEDEDDLDGFGDEEFDDMGGGGGGSDTDELRHRLDELETEVDSISSTMDTVRTENEQISESVDEVEENVRKLLDIYEMVTRGVNPFADEAAAGMGGAMGADSSFGLFEEGEGGGDAEQVDEDIANADAEGFFDDDIGGPDDGGGASVEDVFPEEGEPEEGPDVGDGAFDEDFEDDDEADDGDGGKSFQELKDEYESEEEEAEMEADEDVTPDEGDAEADDAAEGDDAAGADEPESEPAPSTEPEPEPRPRTAADPASDRPARSDDPGAGRATGHGASAPGKPYLADLPAGFASDMLVVEWLEYLLGQANYRETARAIDYYETVDWIDQSVADELHDMLRGLDGVEGGSGGLTIEHHTRSLQYISQLDGAAGESVVLSKLVGGGGSDGIQR